MVTRYKNIISKFKGKKILVVGDVVLDQYIRGKVSRISPEAPVPVVLQEEAFFTPGGAANVANNLRALGADVLLVGKIGRDNEAKILKKELKKRKISSEGLFEIRHKPTALKTRIMALHQQVVRLDREQVRPAAEEPAVDKKIQDFVQKNLQNFDAVIISDYGKGMITPDLVAGICYFGLDKKKIITVDPKVEHFSYYSNVTTITPNKNEAENAIRNIKIYHDSGEKLAIKKDRLETDEDIDRAGEELLRFLELESLLITLGEHGMRLFERGKKPVSIKTTAKEVFDVSGAGDAVISVFTLALTTGASKHDSADLANFAAGIVVSKLGAVAVTPKELLEAIRTA